MVQVNLRLYDIGNFLFLPVKLLIAMNMGANVKVLVGFLLGLLITLSACKKEDNGDAQNNIDQQKLDHLEIEQYVTDQNLNGEFTNSGLYYEILAPGNTNHPTLGSVITASYHGYYLNGTTLDEGSNFTSSLNNLITGWKEGIPKIGQGGKIKMVLPRHLAYGTDILVFDVTLHYFVK